MRARKEWGDKNGLAFTDRDRMHITGGEDRNFRHETHTPLWSASDLKIRLVIYNWLYGYVAANVLSKELRPGLPLGELEQLARRTQQYLRASKWDDAKLQKHVETTRNGMAGMTARLIYLAYRQRLHSPDIALELGMSPIQVRQRLKRINDVARRLFPTDCCERARSYRPEKHPKHGLYTGSLEQLERTVALHAEGYPSQIIAKQLGVSTITIRRRLHRLGITVSREMCPGRVSRYSLADVQRMAAMYAEGKSLLAVAKAFGCAHTLVRRKLLKHEVTLRPIGYKMRRPYQLNPSRSRYSAEDIQRMALLYAEGNSLLEVAKAFSCGYKVVRTRLLKHGVTLRRPSRQIGRKVGPYKLKPRPPRSRYSADDVQRMALLYATGVSLLAVAKAFGCSNASVHRKFRKHGVVMRRRGWRRNV